MTDVTVPNANAKCKQPIVFERGGHVYANSRNVANFFEKRNSDVNRAIRDLDCSADFRKRNFAPNEINDLSGKSIADYDLTKDGFSFLVMGFMRPIDGS